MPESADLQNISCARLTAALEFVGRRWNGAVLVALGRGAERFSEILRSVPGLSDRMLAARLKELEQRGAVARTVVPSIPVQVRYALTAQGVELLGAIRPLLELGARRETSRSPENPSRV